METEILVYRVYFMDGSTMLIDVGPDNMPNQVAYEVCEDCGYDSSDIRTIILED